MTPTRPSQLEEHTSLPVELSIGQHQTLAIAFKELPPTHDIDIVASLNGREIWKRPLSENEVSKKKVLDAFISILDDKTVKVGCTLSLYVETPRANGRRWTLRVPSSPISFPDDRTMHCLKPIVFGKKALATLPNVSVQRLEKQRGPFDGSPVIVPFTAEDGTVHLLVDFEKTHLRHFKYALFEKIGFDQSSISISAHLRKNDFLIEDVVLRLRSKDQASEEHLPFRVRAIGGDQLEVFATTGLSTFAGMTGRYDLFLLASKDGVIGTIPIQVERTLKNRLAFRRLQKKQARINGIAPYLTKDSRLAFKVQKTATSIRGTA